MRLAKIVEENFLLTMTIFRRALLGMRVVGAWCWCEKFLHTGKFSLSHKFTFFVSNQNFKFLAQASCEVPAQDKIKILFVLWLFVVFNYRVDEEAQKLFKQSQLYIYVV